MNVIHLDSIRVAIVGRPNVGKSALFNRLVKRRVALVADTPGVTRDIREARITLGGEIILADTPGFAVSDDNDEMLEMIRATALQAMERADICLFVLEGHENLTASDYLIADILRKQSIEIIVVANKIEGHREGKHAILAVELGMGHPVLTSVEHNIGISELRDVLEERVKYLEKKRKLSLERSSSKIPEKDSAHGDGGEESLSSTAISVYSEQTFAGAKDPLGSIKIAVMGRPNVGKSTLVNAILGQDCLITGDRPGITHDSIAFQFDWKGTQTRIFDTAGISRRVGESINRLYTDDALKTLRFADVVVLMCEPDSFMESQDVRLANMVAEEGRALIFVVNKSDLIRNKGKKKNDFKKILQDDLPHMSDVPLIFLSALKGYGIDELRAKILSTYDEWNRRISTGILNRWLRLAVEEHPPPFFNGRRPFFFLPLLRIRSL
jgi:GTP-binding protein